MKKHIPQPDPDWKAICEKCHDGEIEPECEYYGEPNGCNSPIYGEHPTTDKSSVVGNAAKLREALLSCRKKLANIKPGDFVAGVLVEVIATVDDALAAPPRNCDVGTPDEQEQRYLRLKKEHIDRLTRCPHVGCAVFFPDSLYWAQMPYEAKEGAGEYS